MGFSGAIASLSLTAWLYLLLQTILITSGESSELSTLESEGILKVLTGETWESVKT